MWFNFFKHKEEEKVNVFDGRFISDEEIEEMIKPKTGTFINKEFKEIDDMMQKIRKYTD